jgi:hypothetical protein
MPSLKPTLSEPKGILCGILKPFFSKKDIFLYNIQITLPTFVAPSPSTRTQ